MLFCFADPDLQQDPAFTRCCLSKWFLQELFANGKVKTKKRVPYGPFPKNDMNVLGSSVEIKVVL